MDAQACNRRLDRKGPPSPASALSVGSDAEPTLGSNPRRDLLPIGIVAPLPSSDGHATATISNRTILRVAQVPCALTAHRVGHHAARPGLSRSRLPADKKDGPWRSSRGHPRSLAWGYLPFLSFLSFFLPANFVSYVWVETLTV